MILNNGDRLSGTVKASKDGKLVLETAYAGEVEILLGEISRIRTDNPVRLVLDDDTLVEGVLTPVLYRVTLPRRERITDAPLPVAT